MLRRPVESAQYASNDYTDLLKARGINISMSRKGNRWDNAVCESFMKTLKYEEVLRNDYRNLAEARAPIAEFLDKLYNHKRLHSAPGYMPTAKFEAAHKKALRATFRMSFSKHKEIYPSDALAATPGNGGASPAASAPAHRANEFPTGYSSEGCSPVEPASASPAEYQDAVIPGGRWKTFLRAVNCSLTVCVRSGGKRGTPR